MPKTHTMFSEAEQFDIILNISKEIKFTAKKKSIANIIIICEDICYRELFFDEYEYQEMEHEIFEEASHQKFSKINENILGLETLFKTNNLSIAYELYIDHKICEEFIYFHLCKYNRINFTCMADFNYDEKLYIAEYSLHIFIKYKNNFNKDTYVENLKFKINKTEDQFKSLAKILSNIEHLTNAPETIIKKESENLYKLSDTLVKLKKDLNNIS